MSMPGFGAEAALYQPQIQYRTLASSLTRDAISGSLQLAAVACNPQALAQCIQSAHEGFQECLRDRGSKVACAAAERAEIRACIGEFGICARGYVCCSGTCTSLLNDSSNCGHCGRKCPPWYWCENGQCYPP